ncbi:TIGR03621 family F420-dependent LLM class oxidoreductase [Pseudofrankia inefficax]|uniref:Putative F420-dependent oxidoreductase n=1 Tax=Pseudofrankia inefficax (strain DSM 45817 / CECT 9037 / DDB 130130 / EuI1c) TaxID=298654 RepID=E3J9J0_PSEI1|nr:TIGR03621 family F420-dependent LLM class oxidoreductase [Pseudofrankia inefficax]ADP83354.1 putative F420-dependent oxidoreductase [Pseudofrankia inefficax]
MVRPFRFAVQGTKAKSGAEWRDLAQEAEDLGYSTLFVADHYLGGGPANRAASMPPQHLAPISSMAMAAAVTTTLRVGCRVFCADYHVPAALVKEAATIDLLSDGRMEFGIGAGWNEIEFDAMGLTYLPAPRRIDKLVEVVALAKAHWSGEPIELDGQHVKVSGYRGLPLPVQQPRPPIMVGGGKKRILSFAAREADIVSISNTPFVAINEDGLTPSEELARRVGYVRAAAGDRLEQLDIEGSPWFAEITTDTVEATERIAGWAQTTPEVIAAHPNVLLGTLDEIIERLVERREAFGVNYVSVQQGQLRTFAPIVAALAGK